MELVDRIKTIMKMHNLNAASFADKIGVQRANMSHVLTGRNKPSLDFVERILVSFPKVNAAWLVTGKVNSNEEESALKESSRFQGNIDFKDESIKSQVKKDESNVLKTEIDSSNSKKIVKIITFYEDFTFDEYRPGNKS